MTCECGDTHRRTCPRCEHAIDHHQDQRDQYDDERADRAENRHHTHLLGRAA